MKIVVLGGGVCGLAGAMMLARDGHAVTVLERDPQPPPESVEEAWKAWSRGGVFQFRQPHMLQPGGHLVLAEELPDVVDAIFAAGGAPVDHMAALPPTIEDREPRAGDERFVSLAARRPVLEQVVARAAAREPGLDLRRGVTVAGLELRDDGALPRVTGVGTTDGEILAADLVVDAMGRRSQLPAWLQDLGIAPIHEELEETGFIYYTQYFRSADGAWPQTRGPLLAAFGSFSALTLPADCGTWSVTVLIGTGDQPLKRVRDRDRLHAVVGACPQFAHWLDGEEISGVLALSGVLDRHRRLVVDGRPPVTGVSLLGDSWACTNPSVGRGLSLGLKHAQRLRDIVREHGHDPLGFVEVWDAVTEAELTPFYREQVVEDRARVRQLQAIRDGRTPDLPQTDDELLVAALLAAVPHDAELFRAFMETRCSLTTLAHVLARPGLAERIHAVAAGRERIPPPGPDREQTLALLTDP
jgi:2-polyprenyl-6-methoxyphenol hydroxylase-like FAD-dependent oxidoreductase